MKGEKYTLQKKSNTPSDISTLHNIAVNEVIGMIILTHDSNKDSTEPLNEAADTEDLLHLFNQYIPFNVGQLRMTSYRRCSYHQWTFSRKH